jgi:hypothetical protein
MSKKEDELTKIFNRVASMTPEQLSAIDRQEIENRRNAANLAKDKTDNEKKWQEVDREAERVRMKINVEAELKGCPPEFQKLYKEYFALGNRIHNLQAYGNIKQIAEADELRDSEGKKLREKMLTIVHKGYDLTVKEEKRFVSTVNPEHAIVEDKGTWKLSGFTDENFGSKIEFEYNNKTGLPTAFIVTKTLALLFGTPQIVKERHIIKYTNQEEIDRKRTEELKKRKPDKIKIPKLEWSCTRCRVVNKADAKFCSACGKQKEYI